MKREEELKKILDEKDKWYKEQLESLQNRVRPQLEKKKGLYSRAAVTVRHWKESVLFCPQITVLESRGASVVESQSGQESAADKRLSSQDSTNAQSVDSLLGTKVYGNLIEFRTEVPM